MKISRHTSCSAVSQFEILLMEIMQEKSSQIQKALGKCIICINISNEEWEIPRYDEFRKQKSILIATNCFKFKMS